MKKERLDSGKLRNICIEHDWFTCGSIEQYEKLFQANDIGAGIDELATIIWICSNAEKQAILDVLTVEIEKVKKYQEVMECLDVRDEIQSDISKNFDGLYYHDHIEEIINAHGDLLVELVLALTVQENLHDGRYSEHNKKWAKSFNIDLSDGDKQDISIKAHPCLVNGLIDKIRKR